MMFDPEGDYFTELIKPLAVHTAQLIVGTNSQQMDLVGVRFIPNKGGDPNIFASTAGKLEHFTISEEGVREWNIAASEYTLNPNTPYYVYAKCPRTGTEGTIICSTDKIKLEDDADYYHFWVGVLNSPYEGSRSWNPNYGYTEIAGQTITTGTIKDKTGNSYFDLTNNKFRMGGQQGSLDWNVTKEDQLTLRGCLYQSPAGDVDYPEVDRGAYSDTVVYYPGDKVSYNGNVYKCIKQTTAGIAPTNETYWKILVYRGSTAFKSTVFKRSNTKPSAPTGGSFDAPVPSGWSDGVPSGEAIIWASTRIFTSDGQSPQQASWTNPQQMTDTADFDVEFSSVVSPKPPVNHPNTNTQWGNTANENTIWMATSTKKNGVWSDWTVSKIKGEKGDKGAFKSTVFKRSNTKPSAPTGGSFDAPVPSGWSDGVPSGEAIIWASSCTFNADGTSTGWSDPAAQSDTATLDIEFSPNETQPSAPSGTTPFANHESEGWYDPSSANFAGKTMIWRAERKVSNGAYNGEWTITRIYGEKGEDSYTYDISPDVKSIGLDSDGNATPSSYTCTCYENANGSRVAKTAKWYAYRSNDNVSWGTAYSKQETYTSSFTVSVSKSYKYYKIVAQPYDGIECYAFAFIVKDGEAGPQGLQGAAAPYQGEYSSTKTYYGNTTRTDIVLYNGAYYVARSDAPATSFKGKTPTDKSYWSPFGATFSSVATDLLLAKTITAGQIDVNSLVVRQLRTASTGPRIVTEGTMMSVYGNTTANIRFGIDSNGCAVLSYYDNNGNFLYDLGPEKIREARSASMKEIHLYKVGDYTSGTATFAQISDIEAETISLATYYQYDCGNIGVTDAMRELNGTIYSKNGLMSPGIPTGKKIPDGWYTPHDVAGVYSPEDKPPYSVPSDGIKKTNINNQKPVMERDAWKIYDGKITYQTQAYWNYYTTEIMSTSILAESGVMLLAADDTPMVYSTTANAKTIYQLTPISSISSTLYLPVAGSDGVAYRIATTAFKGEKGDKGDPGATFNGGTVTNTISVKGTAAFRSEWQDSGWSVKAWSFRNSYAGTFAFWNSSFQSGSKACAEITIDGQLVSNSDERLKDIQESVNGILDKIDNINIFKFKWKRDPEIPTQLGVGALSVKDVFPELVHKSEYDDEIGDCTYTLNYSMLGAIVAVGGLKELHAKVKTLEERVAELEK